MPLIFTYKLKFIPFILFSALYGLLPVAVNRHDFYFSFPYYLILLVFILIIYLYYFFKKIIADDDGIKIILFWGLDTRKVKWSDIKEADVIIKIANNDKSDIQKILEPSGVMKSYADKSNGSYLKLIVSDDEPVYLFPNDIMCFDKLGQFIYAKVKSNSNRFHTIAG